MVQSLAVEKNNIVSFGRNFDRSYKYMIVDENYQMMQL